MRKIILALVTILVVSGVVVVPHIVDNKAEKTQPISSSKAVHTDSETENENSSEPAENETILSVEAENGTLTWSEVSGVDVYSIYRSTSKDGGYKKIGVANGNLYSDESSMPGITYYYKYGYELPQNDDNSTSVTQETSYNTTAVKTTAKTTSAKAKNYNPTTAYKVTTTAGVTTTKPTAKQYTNPSSSAKMVTGFEQHMLDLINAEREKYGVAPLSFDSRLTTLARVRASELATYYSADHSRPDKRAWNTVFDDYNYSSYYAGENIAYGQRSADEVMTSWINSPGHHANIVSSNFGHVGLACYEKNGVLYWEQLFTD